MRNLRGYLKFSTRSILTALIVPLFVATVLFAQQYIPNIIVKGAPWYDVRGYTSITTALAGIGASEKTLLIFGNVPVAADTVIPSTTHVWYLNSGKFTVATGKVLTHTGPITAGNHLIWVGPGTIVPPKQPLNLAWMGGLTQAVALLGANVCEVSVQGQFTQAANVTTPSTMAFRSIQPGYVSVSTGFTWTLNGNLYGSPGCFPGVGVVVPSNLQVNDSSWWPSFRKAVADIGANVRELGVTTAQVVSVDTAVPATLPLVFSSGGSLQPSGGVTLTLNCVVSAGESAIFAGAGIIANLTNANPLWFGDTVIISNVTFSDAILFAKANLEISSFWTQLNSLGNYPKVVITGDSLSYNFQDFDAITRTEATLCYPGMNSWAFLIRDALIRHDPDFKHGDEVPFLLSSAGSNLALWGNSGAQFIAPFNGRQQIFRSVAQANTVDLYYRHYGPENKAYCWFLMNPNNTGCSFAVNVDGVNKIPVWNTGGTVAATDPYQGKELHFLEIPDVSNDGILHKITLTNFLGTHATPHATDRDVYLAGISSRLIDIHLTGKGDQSSEWLVTNLATRITDYAPNFVIILIGANDGWAGNPQGLQTPVEYATNLGTIIDGIRAVNSLAKIILLSPPQTDGSVVSVIDMEQYIAKCRKVAYQKKVAFVSLEDLFSTTPTSIYRFDSIHFTKQGNGILARHLADMILPKGSIDPRYLEPGFSVNGIAHTRPSPPVARSYIVYSAPNFTVTQLIGTETGFNPVASVAKHTNDYTIKVTFKINTSLYSNISLRQFDANAAQKITASPQDFENDYVLFQLRKQDGSQFAAGDWATYATSLKFILEVN